MYATLGVTEHVYTPGDTIDLVDLALPIEAPHSPRLFFYQFSHLHIRISCTLERLCDLTHATFIAISRCLRKMFIIRI